MTSQRRQVYEDVPVESSDEDFDDPDGLSKPVGVIRITDRHFRESIINKNYSTIN